MYVRYGIFHHIWKTYKMSTNKNGVNCTLYRLINTKYGDYKLYLLKYIYIHYTMHRMVITHTVK